MMDVVASEPSSPDSSLPDFKDRYTGLCIFGVFEIIGGAIAALLIPATLHFMLSPKIPRPAGTEGSGLAVVSICAWYAVGSVALIVLGTGALRARRWAWALNLILSWFAVADSLASGVPTLGYMLATAESTGVGVVAFFIFVFVISVPLLFLFFYREKDVELTCKQRDPIERWTDRRPLPVLAAVLLALWSVFASLSSLAWTSLPSHGYLLTGWPGNALLLALAAADIYAAVAMFKVHPSGWWFAAGAEAAQAVRTFLQLGQDGGTVTARSAGEPQLGHHWASISGWVVALIFTGTNVAFLLWVRRYFPRRSPQFNSSSRSLAEDRTPYGR